MAQTTNTIIMIRPKAFMYNQETATTNAFQIGDIATENAQDLALKEFNAMVAELRANDVQVMVFDDRPNVDIPDSIFPNNWFSTHDDARVVIYPMQAANRRLERRHDIFDKLTTYFLLEDIIDLTAYEQEMKYLEGTGSMVLDRDTRICYACYSQRTHQDVLKAFADQMGFEIISFDAVDEKNQPIYHTNVLMCVGEKFLLYCAEAIKDSYQQQMIEQSTSKQIIKISLAQMNAFAGNMLEVKNNKGEALLLMSKSAYEALHPAQITQLEKYCKILAFNIPTIENLGGGSVRCMCAEVFLPHIKGKS
jgi:hypothetical protein